MFGFKLEREFVVPLIIGCALLMELMNATVIATALPVIADAFGEDPIRLNLAITAYLLSLGIFIPLSGWLADIYGARRVFVLAILVFTAGSISCAFAVDLWSLIAARMFQGIGGAMMVPVGRLIILRAVEKSRLVDAMAYLTVPALLGPMLGPPLGGFVATYFSWRWIFLINVPIGAIGVVLALKYLPQVSREARAPLDKFGFLCLGLGLGLGLVGPAQSQPQLLKRRDRFQHELLREELAERCEAHGRVTQVRLRYRRELQQRAQLQRASLDQEALELGRNGALRLRQA